MKNIQKIIEIFGGMKELKENYIRLENKPYMRLVIEFIGNGPRDLPSISVAHYYEQNGDAMRDPEITFELDAAGTWSPTTITQDGLGVYQEAVYQDDQGRVMIKPRLIRDLKSLAKLWNKNIGEQGFIEAAKVAAEKRRSAHALNRHEATTDELDAEGTPEAVEPTPTFIPVGGGAYYIR